MVNLPLLLRARGVYRVDQEKSDSTAAAALSRTTANHSRPDAGGVQQSGASFCGAERGLNCVNKEKERRGNWYQKFCC